MHSNQLSFWQYFYLVMWMYISTDHHFRPIDPDSPSSSHSSRHDGHPERLMSVGYGNYIAVDVLSYVIWRFRLSRIINWKCAPIYEKTWCIYSIIIDIFYFNIKNRPKPFKSKTFIVINDYNFTLIFIIIFMVKNWA